MAPEIHPAVQWCEDTDGGKKNAARANRPERGGSREREREMGSFSPSLEDVFDPWVDIQSSCLPSQDG